MDNLTKPVHFGHNLWCFGVVCVFGRRALNAYLFLCRCRHLSTSLLAFRTYVDRIFPQFPHECDDMDKYKDTWLNRPKQFHNMFARICLVGYLTVPEWHRASNPWQTILKIACSWCLKVGHSRFHSNDCDLQQPERIVIFIFFPLLDVHICCFRCVPCLRLTSTYQCATCLISRQLWSLQINPIIMIVSFKCCQVARVLSQVLAECYRRFFFPSSLLVSFCAPHFRWCYLQCPSFSFVRQRCHFFFILFPILCWVDIRWYTSPWSSVVHFINRQSLLFDIILHFVQPSSLRYSSLPSP